MAQKIDDISRLPGPYHDCYTIVCLVNRCTEPKV
jgi:hypothetical protein